MPENIENLLQLIDQGDDYFDGLDLVAPGAPIEDIEDAALLDDADFADLDEI